MGNTSSVRDGELGGSETHSREGSDEMMMQSPPLSPRAAANSPLLFAPQTPMAPLRRREEKRSLQGSWVPSATKYEDIIEEQGIPNLISWSHGGDEVLVEGSWDNWKTKKPLHRSGKDFTLLIVLPSGFYQYRFIVDGEYRYAPDVPWMKDDTGNTHNILDLKAFVADDLGGVAGFETPESPDSSYNNWSLGTDDFSKEPPLVPPQLHLSLLNAVATTSVDCPRRPPPHVVLNHLYIQRGKKGQPVVALGKSHRFLSKYVTVMLYKSL